MLENPGPLHAWRRVNRVGSRLKYGQANLRLFSLPDNLAFFVLRYMSCSGSLMLSLSYLNFLLVVPSRVSTNTSRPVELSCLPASTVLSEGVIFMPVSRRNWTMSRGPSVHAVYKGLWLVQADWVLPVRSSKSLPFIARKHEVLLHIGFFIVVWCGNGVFQNSCRSKSSLWSIRHRRNRSNRSVSMRASSWLCQSRWILRQCFEAHLIGLSDLAGFSWCRP